MDGTVKLVEIGSIQIDTSGHTLSRESNPDLTGQKNWTQAMFDFK